MAGSPGGCRSGYRLYDKGMSMNANVQQHAAEASSKIARSCLLTRTRQISRVLTAIYDEELRPFGINSPQFTLLVLVMELGPLSRSDLGRRNHHDRSTLTRNLQPLIAQAWIAEGTVAEDGRSRPLSLTEQGKALLHRAASAWSVAQEKAKAVLGEAGATALMGIAGDLPRCMT
jgi:DNA-binding MarR family transcriptional regulator